MVVSRRHHAIGTLRNPAEKGVDSGALWHKYGVLANDSVMAFEPVVFEMGVVVESEKLPSLLGGIVFKRSDTGIADTETVHKIGQKVFVGVWTKKN